MPLVYLGGNIFLINHNMHTGLPQNLLLASTPYLYNLNYLAEQANAETGICHGKMKCQVVETAEPKPYCANPA